MKEKEYLMTIRSKRGAVLSVGLYADTCGEPFRLYFCGSDTGDRFWRIGNAARHLERIAAGWGEETVKEYKPLSACPIHGEDEWNKALAREWYLHGEKADARKYYYGL